VRALRTREQSLAYARNRTPIHRQVAILTAIPALNTRKEGVEEVEKWVNPKCKNEMNSLLLDSSPGDTEENHK
jgi:hypothetical protein